MQSHFTVVVVVARGGSGSAVYFLNCCASYRRGRDSENGLRMRQWASERKWGGGGSEGEEEMSRSFELSPWIIARASELAVHESRDDSGGITRRIPQVR